MDENGGSRVTYRSKTTYVSKESIEYERGEVAESLFIYKMRQAGWRVESSSDEEDMNDHWDYWVWAGKDKREGYRVEVKGMKKRARKDQETMFDNVWVELHGVREYDRGWLFGRADYIAFQMEREYFILVSRQDLLKLVLEVTEFDKQVEKAGDALHKIYQRKGRHDRLTMISRDELMSLRRLTI